MQLKCLNRLALYLLPLILLYRLEFPSVAILHQFLQTLGSTYTEVNMRTISVICECSAADIERAKTVLGAKVTEIKN